MKKSRKTILIISVALIAAAVFLVLSPSIMSDFVIRLNGQEEISICYGEGYEEEGASVIFGLAEPKQDGFVQADTIGDYEITYSFGIYSRTRTVHVKDLKAPKIELAGPKTMYFKPGEEYREFGFSAADEIDGDVSESIEADYSELNMQTEGTYYVSYIACDKSGNMARERRKVCVSDASPLSLGLTEFELAPYYHDIICKETEYDEEKFGEIVFVGDSFVGNLAYYGYASWMRTWTKPSISTEDIYTNGLYLYGNLNDEIQFSSAMATLNPSVLFFLINCDWTGRWSAEYLMQSCDAFYGYLKANYPSTKVIICSMLPLSVQYNSQEWVSQMGYNRNERINHMNVYMCELCRKYGFKFMDAQSAFKDPKTGACLPEYISGDYIHINIAGCERLVEYIKHHLDF